MQLSDTAEFAGPANWLQRLGLGSKEPRAWAMYDWANSAFAATIVSAFLPSTTRGSRLPINAERDAMSAAQDAGPNPRKPGFQSVPLLASAVLFLVTSSGCSDFVAFAGSPPGPGIDGEPAWSPDGSEIAIRATRPDGSATPEIYVIDTLGNAVRLTDRQFAGSPSWSPDGLRIAFVGGGLGQRGLYVVNRDGSELTELLARPLGIHGGIAWSPDGETIAFNEGSPTGGSYISLFDIATSVVTRLTQPGSNDKDLSWSPDGSRAVFHSFGQIYRMEADGSGVVRLTDAEPAKEPAWSPCGTLITFTSGRVIYVMDSDGSNVRALTDGFSNDEASSWSPDCSKIAFADQREVWIMNADGSGRRSIP